MRIYLDNCCYNRPYDDQTQLRISLESQAKLHIQDMIKDGKLELVASYVLTYENSRNRFVVKRTAISRFLEDNASFYIDANYSEQAAHPTDRSKGYGCPAYCLCNYRTL